VAWHSPADAEGSATSVYFGSTAAEAIWVF
jgi:hypothetical protein